MAGRRWAAKVAADRAQKRRRSSLDTDPRYRAVNKRGNTGLFSLAMTRLGVNPKYRGLSATSLRALGCGYMSVQSLDFLQPIRSSFVYIDVGREIRAAHTLISIWKQGR